MDQNWTNINKNSKKIQITRILREIKNQFLPKIWNLKLEKNKAKLDKF